MTPLQRHTADHTFLLSAVAEAVGIADPVAIDPAAFAYPLLNISVRGRFVPLAGAFVRDWSRHWPKYYPGMGFGARLYHVEGITFARIVAAVDQVKDDSGYQFFVVSRADYLRLYRIAVRAMRSSQPGPPPVLPAAVLETIRQNTLGFLDPQHLKRIRALGGRPKRGLLFTGPPGNGKTSACRWILQECAHRGYETKKVSPDDYRRPGTPATRRQPSANSSR
jgi:cell division protease FtsH